MEGGTQYYVLLEIPPSKVVKLFRALERKLVKDFVFPRLGVCLTTGVGILDSFESL